VFVRLLVCLGRVEFYFARDGGICRTGDYFLLLLAILYIGLGDVDHGVILFFIRVVFLETVRSIETDLLVYIFVFGDLMLDPLLDRMKSGLHFVDLVGQIAHFFQSGS